jgi:CMP-N-acetylneuraminic acid synthetase
MIVSLILGRGGSTGLPGKNVMSIYGRPLMSYPLMAATNSRYCNKIFLSTDDDDIKNIGEQFSVHHIKRPQYLSTKEALAEDAYIHGYNEIKKVISEEIEAIVLLFCNGATVLNSQIDEGVEALIRDKTLDSACTVSCYNMWSPLRAKKIDENGRLAPFIQSSYFGEKASCDRESQGDAWYADCSMFVVRPRCLEKLIGEPPFTWLGRNVFPIKQWGGMDIDYHWQVPIVKHWLKHNGFSTNSTPYDEK